MGDPHSPRPLLKLLPAPRGALPAPFVLLRLTCGGGGHGTDGTTAGGDLVMVHVCLFAVPPPLRKTVLAGLRELLSGSAGVEVLPAASRSLLPLPQEAALPPPPPVFLGDDRDNEACNACCGFSPLPPPTIDCFLWCRTWEWRVGQGASPSDLAAALVGRRVREGWRLLRWAGRAGGGGAYTLVQPVEVTVCGPVRPALVVGEGGALCPPPLRVCLLQALVVVEGGGGGVRAKVTLVMEPGAGTGWGQSVDGSMVSLPLRRLYTGVANWEGASDEGAVAGSGVGWACDVVEAGGSGGSTCVGSEEAKPSAAVRVASGGRRLQWVAKDEGGAMATFQSA